MALDCPFGGSGGTRNEDYDAYHSRIDREAREELERLMPSWIRYPSRAKVTGGEKISELEAKVKALEDKVEAIQANNAASDK